MTRFITLLILCLTTLSAHAKPAHSCSEARQQRHKKSNAKITLASPLLEQYDVKYVKIDLAMTNLSTALGGNATTVATVTDPAGMAQYAFELSDQLTIDSVKLNGLLAAAIRIDTDVYAISPTAPIAVGNSFSAQIFYHGQPTSGAGFFTRGVNHNLLSTGTRITFTLSDPNLARDWWPCKQSLTDKIDSADLWFTIPNGTMAGSNGRLLAVTPVGTANSRYEWKTRYPIEYYLIATSIAPYSEYTQILHFTGSADSMPIQHFTYDTAAMYPQYKSVIDSTPGIVDYFSTLFGRYPFWQEKYGHCTAPLGGGMEHQTMSTLGWYSTTLIAHELGHQWWGDCVTYGSWRDIWLSEGWASYCEQLYVEHFRSTAAAQIYRTGVFGRVMSRPAGSLYVDDTTSIARIFESRLTYDKGASVAHMLRYIAPNDSVFFSGLRTYQQQYAYRTAATADFQAIMEAAYGRTLDTFFNQWVYGQGFPIYTASWNQLGNDVFIRLEQRNSASGIVNVYAMPLSLRFMSGSGDTTVKVYFNAAQQTYHFSWPRTMTDMELDPENHVLNRADPVIHDATLQVKGVARDHLKVYPNPAGDSWQVSGIQPGSSLKLADASGRVVWEQSDAPATLHIAGDTLSPGVYTLILHNRATVITRKLQKR